MGVGLLYHLTKEGWKDVGLIEKGEWTSGAAWHAAGLVGQLRATRNLTRLAQYSCDLYGDLEKRTGQATGYLQTGSISIATDLERLEELERGASMAQAFDLEVHRMEPDAVAERWPGAAISGVDNSPEMLSKARAENPGISWVQADVVEWAPDMQADVIFSNACLHWLDNHATLFPRLLSALRSGGVLAVQMPRNHASPSHTCIPVSYTHLTLPTNREV